MSLIPSFLTESTETPLGTMPNWLLIAIVIFIIVFIIKLLKGKDKGFRKRDLKKEVKANMNKLFKTFGMDRKLSTNDQLRIGFNLVGRIKRACNYYWVDYQEIAEKGKGKDKKELKLSAKEMLVIEAIVSGKKTKRKKKYRRTLYEFYTFEVYKDNLFGKIRYLLNWNPEFFLIKSEFVDVTGNIFHADSLVQYSNFLNVWVFSKMGRDVIEDIAYKISREIELEEMINFMPKQTYVETSTAQMVAKSREKAKIERDKYSSQRDDLITKEVS